VKPHIFLSVLLVATAVWVSSSAAQSKKQREDQNVRSVQGVVQDQSGKPVEGAVVQLKNVRTLQVRSFITQRDGTYYFHGLSSDVDFELKAEYRGSASPSKTLSVYDTRKKPVINLRLESTK
jgi:Carboxypeptidase regulatory-like domain